MVVQGKKCIVVVLALLIYPSDNLGRAFQPEFTAPIGNLTVVLGRDAVFTCLVEHLGGYRVGWVKADTKAIQAIHDHVITYNPRVYVSHGDHSTWSLQIKGVQFEDAGLYMCQINTDPMKSQTGVLTVHVPSDFLLGETSGDVMVHEGGQVTLTCRARGVPQPTVSWRREDGKDIILRQKLSKIIVSEYKGEELKLINILRHEMGAYLCIASNGVPPAVSKRIIVNVHFPPLIHVPNQLVGAPLGTDVELECFFEASPKAINYWIKDKGSMITSDARHDVQTVNKSPFEVRMTLSIRDLQKQDIGSYGCTAKNSLGGMESSIRLYEIAGLAKVQTAVYPGPYREKKDQQDENVIVYGATDMENMRSKPLDNTVHGHIGYPTASVPPPTAKTNKKGLSIINVSASVGFKLPSSISVINMLLIVLGNFKF